MIIPNQNPYSQGNWGGASEAEGTAVMLIPGGSTFPDTAPFGTGAGPWQLFGIVTGGGSVTLQPGAIVRARVAGGVAFDQCDRLIPIDTGADGLWTKQTTDLDEIGGVLQVLEASPIGDDPPTEKLVKCVVVCQCYVSADPV